MPAEDKPDSGHILGFVKSCWNGLSNERGKIEE
jgi:hypothetical protein